MHFRSDPNGVRVTGVLGVLALAASNCAAQDFTWTGANSLNWFTSQNWSPMMVPTPGSSVLVPMASPLVQLGSGPQPILGLLTAQRTIQISGSVTVGDGSLMDLDFRNTGGMTAPFTVTGQLILLGDATNWNGGAFAGPGLIINSGAVTLTNGGAKIIDGPHFRNDGTITQSAGGLELRAATFDNMGHFELGPQSIFSGTGFEHVQGFENHGTLTKSTGVGTSVMGAPFYNTGEAFVSSGTLSITAQIQEYSTGTLRVGNNATIRISRSPAAGADDPALGGTLTGTGDIVLQAGPLRVAQPLSADLSFDSPNGFLIDVTSGTPDMTLDADIQNSGAAHFAFGRLIGDHALRNLPGGDLLIARASTGGAILAGQASIQNQGTAVVLGALTLADTSRFVNEPGASLELTTGGIAGTSSTLVRSAGVIRKAATATQGTGISAPLVLEGASRIEIESRDLALTNALWTGSTTVHLGGGTTPSLHLTTSNTVSGDSNIIEGAGTLFVGQLTLAHGSMENRLGPAPDAGATLAGPITSTSGEFINTGHVDWNGATLTGHGLTAAFINRGTVTCRGGLFDGGSALNDAPGRFELTSGVLTISMLSQLFNNGTLVFNGGYLAGPDGYINNQGAVEKIGNSSSTVPCSFSNFGMVRVLAGSLTFTNLGNVVGGTLAGGDWYAAPGATLILPQGISTIEQQTYVRGSGASLPWLPHVSVIRGDCTFEGDAAMNDALRTRVNSTMTVLPDTTVTVPMLIENGDDEDVLSEIEEVFVPAFDPPDPPMIVTPVLNNHAVLVPGGHDAPGPFNLTGNLVCFPTSILDVELAGNTPITECDQLSVTGAVMLDGTLRLSPLGAFTPTLGQSFPIIAAGSVSGSFLNIDFPALPDGVAARVRTLPHGAELRIVCPSDFNADFAVNSQDFFDFLTTFFALSPSADLNRDGHVNSQDFFDFLVFFFAGC